MKLSRKEQIDYIKELMEDYECRFSEAYRKMKEELGGEENVLITIEDIENEDLINYDPFLPDLEDDMYEDIDDFIDDMKY